MGDIIWYHKRKGDEIMKKISVTLLFMMFLLLLVGCTQNTSENVMNKEAQLVEQWGNITIVEEEIYDVDEKILVCAFEDSYERIGIAFFMRAETGEYVLDSSILHPGDLVSDNRRVGDKNYIAFYSREPYGAYIEVPEDEKSKVYGVDGLLVLEIEENQEMSIEIKHTKQIIDGEIPCAIDTNGKILFEELPEQEDILSLSSAYAYEMARKLLEINEEQKFLCLSDSLLCSPVALLEGNVLLYPRSGQYETYQMEEEVQMLSGNYVLTKSGNVCRVASESPAWDENVVRSVYDGGDIVAIGADQNSGLCIGVSEQGNIVSIECSSARAQKVQEEVGAWNGLVNIAVSDTKVCGVKADGECIEITY